MLLKHKSPTKSTRLKSQRAAEISRGFVWRHHAFQTRAEDRALINGRVSKLNALIALGRASLDDTTVVSKDGKLIPLTWRSEADVSVPFSIRDYLEFAILVDEFVESKYRESWEV